MRADAAGLREKWPAYLIAGQPGAWNAVHLHSGGVLGPVRDLGRLDREISADSWARPVVTLGGCSIAIRADAGGAS